MSSRGWIGASIGFNISGEVEHGTGVMRPDAGGARTLFRVIVGVATAALVIGAPIWWLTRRDDGRRDRVDYQRDT